MSQFRARIGLAAMALVICCVQWVPAEEDRKPQDDARTGKDLPPPDVDLKALVAASGELGRSVAMKDALLLGTHDRHASRSAPDGILLRELVRQALLIAARDELGLATRDRALRETFPDKGSASFAPVEVISASKAASPVTIIVFRRQNGGIEELWKRTIPVEGNLVTRLAMACEELSRSEFPQVLRDAGYAGSANTWREQDPVAPDVERALTRFNIIEQFATARRLHAEVREKGESPERLAALSRVYAHLGCLTDYYCSPAYKVFQARALLYSERLVARAGQTPESFWTRGYVKALVGVHKMALFDLAAAERLRKKTGAPAPAWGVAAERFCRFDRDGLEQLAQNEDVRPLVRLLQLMSTEFAGQFPATARAAEGVLEETPDCFRAMNTLAEAGPLGIKRAAAHSAFQAYRMYIYRSSARLPGLSRTVTDLAKQGGDELVDDSDLRPRLIGALREAGRLDKDRAEPSLDLLAQLLQELSFVHCLRQIEFEHYTLSVPVDETVPTLEPFLRGHPYQPVLESFALSPPEARVRYADLVKTVDPLDLQLNDYRIFQRLNRIDHRDWARLAGAAYRHVDSLYTDLIRALRRPGGDTFRRRFTNLLVLTSPHSPTAVAHQINTKWEDVKTQADEWENRYDWSDEVLEALASRYQQLKRTDDAERCLKRRVEVAPEYDSYVDLANFYKEQGRRDEWREILERFLEQPSYGLDHARVRAMIANDYMDRQEWDDALPYAREAAESWAAFGLLAAFRCYHGLEDWENAELYIRRLSERYNDWSLEWFYWCKWTGRGNTAAARELAYQYLESLGAPVSYEYLGHIGAYYLLTGEEEKALEVFRASFDQQPDPLAGLHAALIADRLKRPSVRDDFLKQVIQKSGAYKLEGRVRTEHLELARMFRDYLAAGKEARLDRDRIEQLRRDAPPGDATNIDYYIGTFLAIHGEPGPSREYLYRAATSPLGKINRILAGDALHRQNVKVGPMREREVEDEQAVIEK